MISKWARAGLRWIAAALTQWRHMPKQPPLHELEFLKASNNHLDLFRRLTALGIGTGDLTLHAQFVCKAWFDLGLEHLGEAKSAAQAGARRTAYSRAYYAAYNASKATRYLISGFVSLRGDDHARASTDLPGDFPNLASWASDISKLYEHRLRSDYDNWSDTQAGFILTVTDAISLAEKFIDEVRTYLKQKTGLAL